jgi:hypothetical protein
VALLGPLISTWGDLTSGSKLAASARLEAGSQREKLLSPWNL